jgi:hypothetical protein
MQSCCNFVQRIFGMSVCNKSERETKNIFGLWGYRKARSSVLTREFSDVVLKRQCTQTGDNVPNMLERFLSVAHASSVERTLQKLATHSIGSWALTGGLAAGIHCVLRGNRGHTRCLNDVDFVTKSFGDVPETLARDFLFRHVHPFDPPGKTILQAVDAPERLRIDVFRVHRGTLDRAFTPDISLGGIRIVCLEDLVARMARLVLDLTAMSLYRQNMRGTF